MATEKTAPDEVEADEEVIVEVLGTVELSKATYNCFNSSISP